MSLTRIRRALGVLLVTGGLFPGRAGAVTEPPPEPIRLDLYEWMGVAPTVVAAQVIGDEGRFARAMVQTSVKGALATGAVFDIDQRQVNRDREEGVASLSLKIGASYLFLLSPAAPVKAHKDPYPLFDLARGVRGAKALPPEGSAATVDAAARLGEIQSRKDDAYLWVALPALLEDTNPVLVDAALDLYLKFRHESTEIVPSLEPLLSHPRPDFRLRSTMLLGRILARPNAAALPERSSLIAELTGRARRDDEASVRKTAAGALALLSDGGIDETLRAIARDDPDQDVRFEAEKSLSLRSDGAGHRRPD